MEGLVQQLRALDANAAVKVISTWLEEHQLKHVLDSFHDHGYGDVTSLQSKLVRFGNSAADDYPKLPRLTKCEVILKEQHEKLLGAKGTEA